MTSVGRTAGAQQMRTFSSSEVVRQTGITPRQLQWWDEQGIVRPEREGRNRSYSFADLAELTVIAELRRKGFSLQAVRKVMRHLQKQLGRRLAEVVGEHSEFHLLTDGESIYLSDSAQGVVDVLRAARQPLFAVCLADTLRQLRAEVADLDAATDAVQVSLAPGRKHPMNSGRVQHTRAS